MARFRWRRVVAFLVVAIPCVVGIGTIYGWLHGWLTTPVSNLRADVQFGPYSLPPAVLTSGVVSPFDRLRGYWFAEVRNSGTWHVESVVLILPSAVWASVERQGRPPENESVNGAVTIGLVSPGETIHVRAWTDSVPTDNTTRDVRLRHLSGYAPVSFQRAGWRLISGWTAIITVLILIIAVALVFGTTTGSYVYFFRRLPTDEQALTDLAGRLGVSMAGTAHTFAGHTGTNVYEVQRRVLEAIRHRRDSLTWIVVVLAALASVASATAAWLAASASRPH